MSRYVTPVAQYASYPGGKLYFYQTGTSTPQNTYSDAGLSVPNTNPITLDSLGQSGSIFLLATPAYKVVLTDASGNQIWTEDPVTSADQVALALQGFVTIPCTATGVNALTLTPITGAPTISAYNQMQLFAFTAPATSSGSVTARVGGLAFLPVYINGGASQAGNGSLQSGSVYYAGYSSTLNAGSGGFVVLNQAAGNYTSPLVVTTDPSHSFPPVGNSTTTLTSFNVSGTTSSTTTREFLGSLGLVSSKGFGTGSPGGDKVALYTGVQAVAGSGDVWNYNSVLQIDSGSGNISGQGGEIDINNNNQDYGVSSLAPPNVFGWSVSGAGSHLSTGGYFLSGPASPIWVRGMLFGNNCITKYTIQDTTNSDIFAYVNGAHVKGIDFSQGTYSQAVMLIPNSTPIQGIDSGSTARNLISFNSSNALVLAGTGTIGVQTAGNSTPSVDNTYTSGNGTYRWSAVWAANGTIQTSDPSLKTDVQTVHSVLPEGHNLTDLVMEIEPHVFRWKVGGYATETAEEEQTVQDTETVTEEFERVEIRDGKPVLTKEVRSREVPAVDWVQAYDENNAAIITHIPAKPAVIDPETGAMKAPEVAEAFVPRLHPVPRMVTKKVSVEKQVEKPGSRLHWGFLAPHVAAPFKRRGIDFGGHIRDENGVEHLRPDQLIPVAWGALRELIGRMEAVEKQNGELTARLADLEAKG